MPGGMSRRTFLKGSAGLLAALSLASWFPLAGRAQERSPLAPSAPPGFAPMPSSQLASSQPIADIAAGWDGTQWALDSLGVPHFYDPLQQSWLAFGQGVDAAAIVGEDFYLFRGSEVAVYNPAQGLLSVQPIAVQWPQLPASFTRDIDGAFAFGQTLYLCRSGRYVRTDQPSTVVTLNTWPNWSAGGALQEGVVGKAGMYLKAAETIAFVVSGQAPLNQAQVLLADDSFPIEVGYALDYIILPSSAVTQQLAAGFDAYIAQDAAGSTPQANWVFQGPIVWVQTGTAPVAAVSLASWVPAWFPTLSQAPRGRVGSLWSVTTAGTVIYHDGDTWNPAPPIAGVTPLSVDVGADGVPFALATGGGGAALYPLDPTTMAWQPPIPLGTITPQQLSVGDATRVYVLGADGAVSTLQNGSFQPVAALQAGVTHITANHDGTLWHCDGSTANAFRFISEQPYDVAVPISNAARVDKVASTAYGNAFMLVQDAGAIQQLVQYASPYVFKTSLSIVPIENGAVLQNPQVTAGVGSCFVNDRSQAIVALDTHSGALQWRTAAPAAGGFTAMIYDPTHRLVYATTGAATLMALDAATGAPVWSFTAPAGAWSQPISQPVLSGSALCVACNLAVYCFDTSALLAQARNQQPLAPAWSAQLQNPNIFGYDYGTVLLDSGVVMVVLANVSQNAAALWLLDAQTGSSEGQASLPIDSPFLVPLLGRATWYGTLQSTVLSNVGAQWWALYGDTAMFVAAAPSGSGGFRQGFAYHEHTLYAIGNNGLLYSLDTTAEFGQGLPDFQLINLSPSPANATIGAGPLVTMIGQSPVVLFSASLGGANSVWMVDATTNTVLAQISTDQMLATELAVDENGVLYAAGFNPTDPSQPFGQVYAIRIDDALPADRYFIVESELMQDFDEPAAGQLAAIARYQTHVTVVDALKALRPFQAIKVWADTATTVLIDGTPYNIDASTAASVQTGAAGTLTIASDAGDLSTPSLKLWAGFMQPAERIVIYPDRAFHDRLTTTHADPNVASPDPTRVNLATATTYDIANLANPPLLFAASEQQQAGVAAGAVSQLTASAAYQQGITPAPTPRSPAAPPTSTNYLAYADLSGAAYGPLNTPANRLVTGAAAIGFSCDGATFVSMPVAEAADAIDALVGEEPAAPGSFWSKLRELWDKIKAGAAKVARFVVSVGKDIYAGLQYIENGVAKVLRQALHDIEDVAIAIGTVFVQVGKDIAKVVEGLSVIFHLGQVLKTADMIKAVFGRLTAGLPGLLAGAKTTIDDFFANAQDDIASAFGKIIAQLEGASLAQAGTQAGAQAGASGIGGLNGMGATPHSIFAVGPKGSPQTSAQAAPAMWGMHKLRQNYVQTPSQPGIPPGADPLTTFLQNFAAGLQSSGTYNQYTNNFHNTVHFDSAQSFFASLLADLLNAIETLVEDVIALMQTLVDTVIQSADSVTSLFNAAAEVQIPVLSALWNALTGSTLTFLDVIAFVIAIPVTLVYRIVEGEYPGDQLASAAGAEPSVVWNRVVGVSSAINTILNGIFSAINDVVTIASGSLTGAQQILGATLALGLALDVAAGDALTTETWVIVASVIELVLLLLNAIPPLPPEIPSFTGVALSPLLLVAFWQTYAKSSKLETDALGLSSSVIGTLATIINPIKFAPVDTGAPVVAPIADVFCAEAAAGLTLGATIKGWGAAVPPTALPVEDEPAGTPPHQIFMPAVLQGEDGAG